MSKSFLYDLRVGSSSEFVMICNGFIILLEHRAPGCGSTGNIHSNNYCEELNLTFFYFTDMHSNDLKQNDEISQCWYM